MIEGTNANELIESVKILNNKNVSTTIDNLGEYVTSQKEVYLAKKNILEVLEIIHNQKLNAHLSIKLTQLGLDINYDLCKIALQKL